MRPDESGWQVGVAWRRRVVLPTLWAGVWLVGAGGTVRRRSTSRRHGSTGSPSWGTGGRSRACVIRFAPGSSCSTTETRGPPS